MEIKIDNYISKNYKNSLLEEEKYLNPNTVGNPKKISMDDEEKDFFKNVKFSYMVDHDTGKIRIRVYNFLTGETIQEIPSDKFLEFLKELKKGLDDDVIKKQGLLPEGIFFENSI